MFAAKKKKSNELYSIESGSDAFGNKLIIGRAYFAVVNDEGFDLGANVSIGGGNCRKNTLGWPTGKYPLFVFEDLYENNNAFIVEMSELQWYAQQLLDTTHEKFLKVYNRKFTLPKLYLKAGLTFIAYPCPQRSQGENDLNYLKRMRWMGEYQIQGIIRDGKCDIEY